MASKSVDLDIAQEGQRAQLEGAARFIIDHVSPTGHMSASPNYKWYTMHWFRDSAFTTTALFEAGEFLNNKNQELATQCMDAAKRINSFNIDAIANHMDHIREGNRIALEMGDFNQLKYHVPAKVGRDGRVFRGMVGNIWVDDTDNNGLVQHDSVPLVLLALVKEIESTGTLGKKIEDFLGENLKTLVEYMAKYFKTECCNAWEEDCGYGHAYDVAAMHAGFEAAKKLSAHLSLDYTPESIDRTIEGNYEGGPLKYMKDYFIRDNVLYGMRDKYSENPRIDRGVDTQFIFAFNMFGITDKALGTKGVVRNTMTMIEKTLFQCKEECSPHMLGLRYEDDSYFRGGRWLISGAQRADYYLAMAKPNLAVAREYSRYFGTFGGSYPEQVLEHPASKKDRPDEYLLNNGGKMIQDLLWSYAEVLRFEVRFQKLLDERNGKQIRR